MLLFIKYRWSKIQGPQGFQYISCYCLSARTVICFAVFCISIHLMLLFIGDPAVERIQEALFQYILCYCLSDGARGVKLFIQISIHLMLLFILSGSRFRPTHVWFQYISCYCLSRQPSLNPRLNSISIHLMLLFIVLFLCIKKIWINFNTSHVTVYRKELTPKQKAFWFQYISCYCLSLLQLLLPNSPLNFNTSHVTVYPFASVSAAIQPVFQYISCYCLSFCGKLFWKIYDISIHLMLLFIKGFQ